MYCGTGKARWRVWLASLVVVLAANGAPGMAGATEISARVDKVRGAKNLQTIHLKGDTLFAFNATQLSPKGKQALNALLKQNVLQTLTRYKITGHTDHIGGSTANRQLSLRRAEAVRQYLIVRNRNLRLEVAGLGETLPLVSCSSKLKDKALVACLAPNRRVEIDPLYE